MKTKEFIGGIVGTILSSTGAIANLNEWLTIVSTVITILGGILTLIIIPLVSWYRRAKEDGKITTDELKEGADIIKNGVEDLKEQNKDKDKE